MKEPLEIVIHKNGLTLCHPTDCRASEFVAREEKGVGRRIADFIDKGFAHASTLHLFVSEDLLFFKVFELPLDTVDIEEAVGYQLEMVTPFGDEATWHSFAVQKGDEAYHITLYAAKSGYIDAYIQEIMEGGFPPVRYLEANHRRDALGLQLGPLLVGQPTTGPVIAWRQLAPHLLRPHLLQPLR